MVAMRVGLKVANWGEMRVARLVDWMAEYWAGSWVGVWVERRVA